MCWIDSIVIASIDPFASSLPSVRNIAPRLGIFSVQARVDQRRQILAARGCALKTFFDRIHR